MYGAGGSRRGSESFLERAGQIDVIAPQSYGVDSLGNVSGAVPQRLIDEALATGTRLMPLIMNPGFNQAQIHGLLANPDGRRRTVEFMVKEGIEKGFWGVAVRFRKHSSLSQRCLYDLFFGKPPRRCMRLE